MNFLDFSSRLKDVGDRHAMHQLLLPFPEFIFFSLSDYGILIQISQLQNMASKILLHTQLGEGFFYYFPTKESPMLLLMNILSTLFIKRSARHDAKKCS